MAPEWVNAQDDNGSVGSSDQQAQQTHVYDYVIIGAGMIGIFSLSEGLRQGATNICLLESKSRPGGLWATLPKWQTVQNAVMDFCIEGFTSKKKVWAADDVLHFVDEYIKAAKLDPYINYGRYVCGYEWSQAEEIWTLRAKRHKVVNGTQTEVEEVYRCRQLIMCCGKHVGPKIPHIPHNDGSVPVLHNTQIDSFEQFKGKKVVVMGAGASALDMLINTLKTNVDAKPSERGHFVHWLVREPKYFCALDWNDIFPLTVVQLLFGRWGIHIGSWIVNVFTHVAFFLYGVHSWLPKDHAFDFERDQIVPNRGYVLTQKKRIKRVDGAVEVVEIKDRRVVLRGGEVIEDVDALLMGTGFTAPEYDPALGITDKTEFFMKVMPLGKLQGKLIISGTLLLDASAATPSCSTAITQYIWSLIMNADHSKLQDQKEGIIPNDRLINHIELLNYPMGYRGDCMKPFVLWRFRALATLIYYRLRYNTSVYFKERLLGVNMHLD